MTVSEVHELLRHVYLPSWIFILVCHTRFPSFEGPEVVTLFIIHVFRTSGIIYWIVSESHAALHKQPYFATGYTLTVLRFKFNEFTIFMNVMRLSIL